MAQYVETRENNGVNSIKIDAVIRTIPSWVMGGIGIMLFSMIVLIRVNTIKN